MPDSYRVDPARLGDAVLERVELGLRALFPAYVRNARVDVEVDASVRKLEVVLTSWLWGGKTHITLGRESFPTTLWDHMKTRLPMWAQRRLRPARFTAITKSINITRMCPHLVEDDRRLHLRFLAADYDA